MKPLLLILPLTLIINGCISRTDETTEQTYESFVSVEIELQDRVLVCMSKPLKSASGEYIKYQLVYNLSGNETCKFGETYGYVLPGSNIEVLSVEKHKVLSLKPVTKVFFIGVAVMGDGTEIRFFYNYENDGFSDRQPW